ncbi:MAG: ATP-grasp domain-containing protein [Candidatus Acidiferrales bacterium]
MMRRSDYKKRTGAVVLGGDYQGLGIVRSLGRRGIPVCVIDDQWSIARYSRYTELFHSAKSLLDTRLTIDTLREAGTKYGMDGWVIYPTRDELVAAVSQCRDELTENFRVSTPGWGVIRWLWDKRNTHQLAEKLGIPIPRTWYPCQDNELKQLEGHFPVVIKPAIKEHFIYATRDKAWRADERSQLRALYDRALRYIPAEEIMVQDLVPGDGGCQYSYCAFFKDGKSVASLTACRRRQHPIEFGRASTYVETVNLPLLKEYSERFLRSINYYGLVELEYKRDTRDGSYRLLDVNGRTWGYHTIGRSAGVDFPYLLFSDQMNEPIQQCVGRAGVRWIRLLTDLPTAALSIWKGELGVRSYLETLHSYDEEAVFSREDPLPGLMEIALIPYLSVKRGF